jgi:hypothetical protein
MDMRLAPYLIIRDSGYFFRIAIPKCLRAHYKKTEIRRSLGTFDRRQAMLLGAIMSANVRAEFHSLTNPMAAKLPIPLDLDKIRQLTINEIRVGNTVLSGIEVDTKRPEELLVSPFELQEGTGLRRHGGLVNSQLQ